MSATLEELEEMVELEGYTPGTPEYDRVLLARRVQRCREMRDLTDCRACQVFEYCEWAREYLVQLKYKGR